MFSCGYVLVIHVLILTCMLVLQWKPALTDFIRKSRPLDWAEGANLAAVADVLFFFFTNPANPNEMLWLTFKALGTTSLPLTNNNFAPFEMLFIKVGSWEAIGRRFKYLKNPSASSARQFSSDAHCRFCKVWKSNHISFRNTSVSSTRSGNSENKLKTKLEISWSFYLKHVVLHPHLLPLLPSPPPPPPLPYPLPTWLFGLL